MTITALHVKVQDTANEDDNTVEVKGVVKQIGEGQFTLQVRMVHGQMSALVTVVFSLLFVHLPDFIPALLDKICFAIVNFPQEDCCEATRENTGSSICSASLCPHEQPCKKGETPVSTKPLLHARTLLPLLSLCLLGLAVQAQPIIYQGMLKEGGVPANGIYDFRFRLYNAPEAGLQVGVDVLLDNQNVQNGLFTAELSFGGGVWTGASRYLEIAVRPGASTGLYTTLAPRVMIATVPYSYFASSVPWSGVTGAPSGFPPIGSAGGDLSGSYPNPTVVGLQGKPVSAAVPANGQVLKWNGSAWASASDQLTLPFTGNAADYIAFRVNNSASYGSYAGWFETRYGSGVFGYATAIDVTNQGVTGLSESPTGWGVVGYNRSTGGGGYFYSQQGKTGAVVAGRNLNYYSDWPDSWAGGLATWDIACAGIRYNLALARSDARLKRDIRSLNTADELQRLLSLHPVSYHWRDERLPQTLQYGFNAQELREVFPELVEEGGDAEKTLSVNYQALIPLLVNALQVQQATIQQQEARIQRLEAELQQLRALIPRSR